MRKHRRSFPPISCDEFSKMKNEKGHFDKMKVNYFNEWYISELKLKLRQRRRGRGRRRQRQSCTLTDKKMRETNTEDLRIYLNKKKEMIYP